MHKSHEHEGQIKTTSFKMNKCCHCNRNILDKSNYAKHMRICNKNKLNKKKIQDSSLHQQVNKEAKLIEIVSDHYLLRLTEPCSQQKLQCEICRKIFNKKFNFHRHLRVHYLNEIMSHEHDPEFVNKQSKSYTNVSLNVNFFECIKCKRIFNEKCQLEAHMLKWHRNLFTCGLCKAIFSERFELIKHMNSVHSAKFKFECQHCLKSFRYLSHYFEHRRTHLIKAASNGLVSFCVNKRFFILNFSFNFFRFL